MSIRGAGRVDLPRSKRKWIIGFLYHLCVPLEPPLRSECLHVIPPDVDIPVDRVARYTQDSSLREILAAHRQTTFRGYARQADTGGGVQTDGLVDDGLEILQILGLFKG